MDRALHGVNLTGWLTLEPWVSPSLFADSGVLDEVSLIESLGADEYKRRIDEHRATFIRQADFNQIAARGFNAVRLPVPWYVFGDAGPFAGSFVPCIELVDEAVDWADELGLSLVLVLDVYPGAQQREQELARLLDGKEKFRTYKDDLLVVLAALARRYAHRMSFAGLEVASDPVVAQRNFLRRGEGVPLHYLRNYYRDAYVSIRHEAGEDVAVILPDASLPGAWHSFMAHERYTNVWIDAHIYHYNDETRQKGAMGVRELSMRSKHTLGILGDAGFPVMIGEWSGSLPFADTATTPEGRVALERVFIGEQLATYSSCAAWFFQTWKTEGRLQGWDAQVSLASFQRGMFT